MTYQHNQDITDGFSSYTEHGDYSPAEQTATAWSAVNVRDGSVSVSISDGDVRTSVSDTEATTISTLPSDVLTINGVTATKQSFINAGILNEDGSSKDAIEDQEASLDDQGGSVPHALTEEAVEALNYAFEDIPDASLPAVTSMGIAAVVGNGDVSGLVDEVVRITGEHPGYAQERFEQAQAIFQKQADRALTSAGITDLEAFYSYAKTSHKGALMDAVNRQVYGSDLSGYTPIVKAFMLKASGYGSKTM